MKIPKKLIIKKTDSKELQEVKQTLNDLLEFHYQFHKTKSGTHVHALTTGGGGC